MTPQEFIARWSGSTLSEKAGAQSHFNDLCDMLGVDRPVVAGEYQFEYGAGKTSGGNGWADVWKRGYFGWENKAPGKNLSDALKQLLDYSLALGSPPLLVVSDRERIEVHTAFNGYPDEPKIILIKEIDKPENLQILKWIFTNPERLRPAKSSAAITEEAAGKFAELAEVMNSRGEDPHVVAHFLTQCLFCMFAEDEGLLPGKVFESLLMNAKGDGDLAATRLHKLFNAMKKGGDYGDNAIAWFNGGLFKTIVIPEIDNHVLKALTSAAHEMDWRAIEPAIFGTLFERGLNPKKRSQLGAHYTDTRTIMRIIEAVVIEPLLDEWNTEKSNIVSYLEKSKKARDASYKQAQKLFQRFLERLRTFRVLDPACGSGNFLYLSLKALKDIEKRVNLEAEALGLQRQLSIETCPANVLGIEIDPYAAELARVTVWIGEIQWMLQNGYDLNKQPILRPLDHIENRDALLNVDGVEAEWPQAHVVIGNPPFVGDKKMISELGSDYVETLRKAYGGRVPGGADLVCYWFEKANDLIRSKLLDRAGLVATNSIRGGRNREVLKHVCESTKIFTAWSDEAWVNEGAAVRVSIVCFGSREIPSLLDDQPSGVIYSDLSSGGESNNADLTLAVPLAENAGIAFSGITKKGAFDIDDHTARALLEESGNPNGKPNSDVVFPWKNGEAIVGRDPGKWIIHFGERSELDASMYARPFGLIEERVKPVREQTNAKAERINWWKLARRAPDMFNAISNLERFIVTPEVSKHRIFTWLKAGVVPDKNLVVIARNDDITFGILQSKFHEVWALRMGTSLEDRPRYTSSTTFRTFPFPDGLTPNIQAEEFIRHTNAKAIGDAARELVKHRDAWLCPPEWIDESVESSTTSGEVKIKTEYCEDIKARTFTNLYNQRPAWLNALHTSLDKAVAEAYGWKWPMTETEIINGLFLMNGKSRTQ